MCSDEETDIDVTTSQGHPERAPLGITARARMVRRIGDRMRAWTMAPPA